MSASALFIMDLKGRVLIQRDYRGDVTMSAADKFTKRLSEEQDEIKPILTIDDLTFVNIKHNNVYLMAVTQKNTNAMVILNFMYQCVDVFVSYFADLCEESIKDNFVITYELLDEMMDFGYPQATEPKVLKEYICIQEKHKMAIVAAPTAITNVVSWRSDGIKHKKNEIFLDVIEQLHLLVSSSGSVLKSEIMGVVKMKSFLSGMPELKLGLNDKVLMDSSGRSSSGRRGVDMEDIRFHQCVKLSRFENDRTISFVPPDGDFDLMTYRLNTKVRPLIWVEAVVEPHSGRIEFMIKARSNFKRQSTANNVEIIIPVPADADTPKFKSSIGKVEYCPENNNFVWKIKQFQGQKEYLTRAHFGLPSVGAEVHQPNKTPISVKFEIPYFTVSGIQVRYLKIIEKSGYTALPWVRYITQNGDYQIRM